MKENINYAVKRLGWVTIKLLRFAVLTIIRRKVLPRNYSKPNSKKIGLFPYGTSDCIILYQLLAEYFKSMGFYGSEVILKRNSQSKLEYIPLSNDSLCYEDRLKEFSKICGASASILRGIIDSYRKNLEAESFFLNEKISRDFWEKTQDQIALAKIYAEKYDVLFITEIAYTFCRALHFYAIERNKKVFVINPHGELLDVSHPDRKTFHSITYEEAIRLLNNCDVEEGKRLHEISDEFFRRRLLGENPNDRDAALSFSNFDTEIKKKPKKVLYLHCFRDDSQCLDSSNLQDVIKQDLFLWSDKSLREISKDPSNWYVKIHPNNIQYEGEVKILANLLSKHNLNNHNILEAPATSQVLSDNMPAYTLSGTIALESAAAGFKSFTMSNYHPSDLTRKIDMFEMGNELEIELIEEQERKKARIFLMLKNQSSRPIFGLITKKSVRPTTDEYERIKFEMISLFSIFQIIFSRNRIAKIRVVFDELVRQFSSEGNFEWNLKLWSEEHIKRNKKH